MIIILLLIPMIACGLFWLTKNRNVINIINAAATFSLLITAVFIIKEVLASGSVGLGILGDNFYIDSLNSIVLLVTTAVSFLVSIYSIGYINEELKREVIGIRKLKVYYTLMHAFIFTMILAITAQNMGLMWIAVEATTLASAFLVGFYNDKKSIEAAWKYIIVCSVGIAFAMLGIVTLYYSSVHALGQSAQGLNWLFLLENAGKLQGGILKMSFIFIIVGFGTKVGLAPMHTWLPDAHSQAPSPISALLSGVLLNRALYGIIRVMIIVNKSIGSSLYTGRLLMVLGILSLGTAAVFILVQQDFKRMLAYSSIEHMGIIAFALGILSPLSIFGALFHIINHAFTKSMLFAASGNIYLKYETKKIKQVRGVLKVMPITGVAFIIGLFAIVGMPPFSVFGSELSVIVSSFQEAHYFGAALMLLFLVMIFAGFVTQLLKMFYGKPVEEDMATGEINKLGSVVLLVFLVIITVTGLYLPAPVKTLINSASDIILGGVVK